MRVTIIRKKHKKKGIEYTLNYNLVKFYQTTVHIFVWREENF